MDAGGARGRGRGRARARLFEIRELRVHPATDDKVLAAWNGLAIRALAEAGRAFGEPAFVEAADAMRRLRARAPARRARPAAPVLARRRAGRPGFADDHALMASACLTLYETTFELALVRGSAGRWPTTCCGSSTTPSDGGFFQTGRDAEALVVRPKELYDNAVPGGNSAAAEVLLRLALLTGEPGTRTRPPVGAPAGPRRHGPGPDGLRTRAVRARPVPGPGARGRRSSATATIAPTAALVDAVIGSSATGTQRRARGGGSRRRCRDARRCRCSATVRRSDGRPDRVRL